MSEIQDRITTTQAAISEAENANLSPDQEKALATRLLELDTLLQSVGAWIKDLLNRPG